MKIYLAILTLYLASITAHAGMTIKTHKGISASEATIDGRTYYRVDITTPTTFNAATSITSKSCGTIPHGARIHIRAAGVHTSSLSRIPIKVRGIPCFLKPKEVYTLLPQN